MHTIENKAGRLIETKIASPIDVSSVGSFRAELGECFKRLDGKVLICVDLMDANVFPPDVAQAFGTVMKVDNPRIERSALLVGEGALFSMQVERLIRDAGNPARQAFRKAHELIQWLGELATPAEMSRLEAFLAPRLGR